MAKFPNKESQPIRLSYNSTLMCLISELLKSDSEFSSRKTILNRSCCRWRRIMSGSGPRDKSFWPAETLLSTTLQGRPVLSFGSQRVFVLRVFLPFGGLSGVYIVCLGTKWIKEMHHSKNINSIAPLELPGLNTDEDTKTKQFWLPINNKWPPRIRCDIFLPQHNLLFIEPV